MSGTDHSGTVPLLGNATATTTDSENAYIDDNSPPRHERTDSGFEEMNDTPKARRSPSTSSATGDLTPTPASRRRKPRQIPRTMSSSSAVPTTSRSSSRNPNISSESSRPTSSQRDHSRHSFVSTTARRSSKSRHSSLLLHQRMSSYNSTQPLLHKDTFSSAFLFHENPFLAHSRSDSADDPFISHTRSTSISPTLPTRGTFPNFTPRANLRSPSLPTLPSTFPPRSRSEKDPRPVIQARSYSNFVPATTIDWTLPSTRQKEYEEIDRKCRGVRGLWRKVWQKDKGVRFWDEKKGHENDGGSVRRYRLDLDGENAGEEESEGMKREQGRWKLWKGLRRKKEVEGGD